MLPHSLRIHGIEQDRLVVFIDGKQQIIPNNWSALQQLGKQFSDLQITVGDKIYNIGSINEATFNLIVQEIKLPRRLCNLLPRRSRKDIVGRERDIAQVRAMLEQEQALVVVNAIGGMGKTTLLEVYVDSYFNDYHNILWVKQGDGQSLPDAFISTEGLFVTLGIDQQNTDPKEWFTMVVARLHRIPDRPCLLLIDNAQEDLANYRHQIPCPPNWHVLISSRESIYGYTEYALDQLSPDEALQLFNRHYTRNAISTEDRQKLLARIEYHTLAIEILAKTAQVMRFDAQQLFEALATDAATYITVAHQPNSNQRIQRVMGYLESIYDLSRIEGDALSLLCQFTYLPAANIPYSTLQLLLDTPNNPLQHRLLPSLQALREKGWISEDSATDSYRMHTIVAQIIRKKQAPPMELAMPLLENVTACLHLDQSKDNPADKFVWVPYGERLVEVLGSFEVEEMGVLQNNLALVLKDLGEYAQAQILLLKAISIGEKHFGTEHPTLATYYSNLALVLQNLGNYEQAKSLLLKAISIEEKHFGTEHPTLAAYYSNLATVLQHLVVLQFNTVGYKLSLGQSV